VGDILSAIMATTITSTSRFRDLKSNKGEMEEKKEMAIKVLIKCPGNCKRRMKMLFSVPRFLHQSPRPPRVIFHFVRHAQVLPSSLLPKQS
jgi:hypothetical protein